VALEEEFTDYDVSVDLLDPTVVIISNPTGEAFEVSTSTTDAGTSGYPTWVHDFGSADYDAGDVISYYLDLEGGPNDKGGTYTVTEPMTAVQVAAAVMAAMQADIDAVGATISVSGAELTISGPADWHGEPDATDVNITISNVSGAAAQQSGTFTWTGVNTTETVGITIDDVTFSKQLTWTASSINNDGQWENFLNVVSGFLVELNAAFLGKDVSFTLNTTITDYTNNGETGVIGINYTGPADYSNYVISGTAAAGGTFAANVSAGYPAATVTANEITETFTAAGAATTDEQSLTATDAETPYQAGTVAGADLEADVLTGGTGNDIFVVLNSNTGQNMLTDDVFDTITDLNLGEDSIALQFEISAIATEETIVAGETGELSLADAVALLFADAGVLHEESNTAMILHYQYGWDGTVYAYSDAYLVAANGAGDVFGTDDAIVKITGVVGTLDTLDFVLVGTLL